MKYQFPHLSARSVLMPVWLWFCLLLVTACQTSPVVVDVPTPSAVAIVDQLATTTPTPVKTATLTSTVTSTHTATPTVTATNTPTLTPTPVSTLPPVAALAVVEDLLSHNAYCRLPCWWGAIPGQTTWQEIEGLLISLSARIVDWDDNVQIVYIPHVPEGLTGSSLGMQIFYKRAQSIIQHITVTGANMPSYYLQPILATHGPPDEVWIQAMPYTPTGEVMFRIALLYLEQGFSAHILTRMTSLADGQVIGCFSADARQGTSLFLWVPGKYTAFPIIVREGRFGQEASSYLPLQEATGMDVVTFYNNYKEAEAENCVSTPADIWRY
jgi:hypothetical protein